MLGSFSVSQTGLNAAKIAVENVSNNIANENTPGYKKRVAQLSEIANIGENLTGRGVEANDVYRITSEYLFNRVIDETSKTDYYDKLSGMLANVENVFKETDESGFSENLNRYFQAVENLRANPNSEIHKTSLKSEGKVLVESLKDIYTTIEKLQRQEKAELEENVDKINTILNEIGNINNKLQSISGPSNDLLDKRDKLELELSSFVDIEVNRTTNSYQLDIAGEMVVLNTNVSSIGVKEDLQAQVDRYTIIDTSTLPNRVYDPIKYKEDFTARTYVAGDTVTYKLNNDLEVSVEIGDFVKDGYGNNVDLDGDSVPDMVDETNIVRALVYKINTSTDAKGVVTAYNGNYTVDANGNKITDDTKDNFLRIESFQEGVDESFEGRISIVTASEGREAVYKNDYQSQEAETEVLFTVYDKGISLNSGSIKAQIENLSSTSPNNKYQKYLDKLDSFAQTLADVTDKYIQVGKDDYLFGEATTDENAGVITNIGLFSGASVKTLEFNKNAVNDLDQKELDYLGTLQWKKDFSYTGMAQDNNVTKTSSFSEFFQDIKVDVAKDKENNDLSLSTEKGIKNAVKSSLDELVNVDKDEEMINLLKFQAAYTANAQVITTLDEMLEVLLGLKR